MDENKNIENSGFLNGFDEVSRGTEGYTVTPDGGFYTTKEEKPTAHDILEENFKEETEEEVKAEPIIESKPSFHAYSYTEPKAPREKRKFSLTALIASVLVASIVGAFSGVGAMLATDYFKEDNASGGNHIAVGDGSSVNINVKDIDATVVEAVAAKVTPSVVGIRTTVSVTNFFGGTQEASGEGSGVIYTEDGYIITNYHVIGDAIENSRSNIQVFLNGDTENSYEATVVGYNISCDLAVIKINAKNLTKVTFASTDNLRTGQFVVAIGNPGGLEFMGSVTYGVISGLNRIVSDGSDKGGVELIQTDAAINPGNSGGALANTEGQLIGINSSKIVSESYEGMGFSIPADTVKEICDKIIAKEYDPDPYIGVAISERYDPETLEYYGYPVGAVINSVVSGSPADNAGLVRGDIITEFNGVKITHYTVFTDTLSQCKPGEKVELKIYRGGREYSGSIKIGSNNSQ